MKRAYVLTVALVLGLGAHANGQEKVDKDATKYLKQMCSYLAKQKAFSFQVDTTFEEVYEDGLKVQLANRSKVSVVRPNKVNALSSGDTANRRIVYDGKTVSFHDKKAKIYATVKAPKTIDAMLDHLYEKYGYSQPIADLLFSEPYKVLTENIKSGTYFGIHQVGGVKCHHLAFRQETLDWQIWIEAGKKPLPRKVVITFRKVKDQPQFQAYLSKWNTSPKFKDSTFEFTPPSGATKVEMIQRSVAKKSKKTKKN